MADYDIGGGVKVKQVDSHVDLAINDTHAALTPAMRRALLAALTEIEAQDTQLTEDEHAY